VSGAAATRQVAAGRIMAMEAARRRHRQGLVDMFKTSVKLIFLRSFLE